MNGNDPIQNHANTCFSFTYSIYSHVLLGESKISVLKRTVVSFHYHSLHFLSYWIVGKLVPNTSRLGSHGRVHLGPIASISQGTITNTHPFNQFRDANYPKMCVFGLGEETGIPEGNCPGTWRTCKLHIHLMEAGIKPPTLVV